MTTAGGSKAGTRDATRIQDRRTIPTSYNGADYLDELDKYLDRLLGEALDETFPASDQPSQRCAASRQGDHILPPPEANIRWRIRS
jgi:hypothetical protein